MLVSIHKNKRVCFKCKSTTTYINKKHGWEQWNHDKKGNIICNRCYKQLFGAIVAKNYRKRHVSKVVALNARRIKFKDRIFYTKIQPRIGVCNWCRAVYPFDTKQTQIHHERYDEKNPLNNTIELCASCHRKTFIYKKRNGVVYT